MDEVNERDREALASRDWWLQLEPVIDARLFGWSYRHSAQFDRGRSTIYLDGDTGLAILAALAQAARRGEDEATEQLASALNEMSSRLASLKETMAQRDALRSFATPAGDPAPPRPVTAAESALLRQVILASSEIVVDPAADVLLARIAAAYQCIGASNTEDLNAADVVRLMNALAECSTDEEPSPAYQAEIERLLPIRCVAPAADVRAAITGGTLCRGCGRLWVRYADKRTEVIREGDDLCSATMETISADEARQLIERAEQPDAR